MGKHFDETDMIINRFGEDPESRWYRSSRLYQANGLWWFDTREGVPFGPFVRKTAAICSLAVYVAQHVHEACAIRTTELPGSQDKISHLVAEVVEVLKQQHDFGETAAINWARSRLFKFRNDGNATAATLGCIRVLEFVIRHPKQTFDFEHLLKCRAG
jgi:hypothetical protein